MAAPRRWSRRGRGLAGAHVASALVAVLLSRIPLFDLLGFEFSTAIGAWLAIVSGLRACAAARAGREPGATGPFPGRALLGVAGENLTLPVTPLAVIAANALVVPNCNWGAGLAFYALLPLPGVVYGTAVGFACGLAFATPRARLAFLGWVLATVGVALARLVREPPKFAFNAVAGYFPGPVYDAEVEIGPALLAARGCALLDAALFVLAAALCWDGARLRARRLCRAWDGERAVLGTFLLAVVALRLVVAANTARLGLAYDRADIQAALGGRIETAHCVLYYDPAAYDAARAARFAAEHEARYAQLAHFFGREPRRKIGSYVYASAAEKKRLMGAAGTSFEDALHDEFHINATSEDPHPVLTHEMAHIFAAQIDRWVPVCWKIGIHEGIAVAAEWDEESARLEMTPHEASAAMDSLGLLPDLETALSAAGFWTQPGARAYTACGSFVRHLVDTRGMESFRRLWRRGDFESAYGLPLQALVAEWQAELDRVPLDAALLRRADRLFRPPGIFSRPCAHEAARLQGAAQAAMGRGEPARAESLYRRLAEIEPEDPETLLGLARARLRSGDPAGAERVAFALLSGPRPHPAWEARAVRLAADGAWLAGDFDRAAALFDSARARAGSHDEVRACEVALGIVADEALRGELAAYLTDTGLSAEAGLALLSRARAARPESPLVRYLLGRRLYLADLLEPARLELGAALQAGLTGRETVLACRELLAAADLGLGRVEEALARYLELEAEPVPEARRLGYRDGARRARFALGPGRAP